MTFRSRRPFTVVEAKNWSRQIGPQRKTVIVLHCMETPSNLDTAEWCARFFAGTLDVDPKTHLRPEAPQSSAHFTVDADSIVQCVPAELVAWGAPGCNQQGIHVEHPGRHSWTREQWLSGNSRAALQNGARLVAELAQHFRIPCEFLEATDLRNKLAGITTHEQVTLAWPDKGHGHIDPGPGFPLGEYLDWVRSYTGSAWGEI